MNAFPCSWVTSESGKHGGDEHVNSHASASRLRMKGCMENSSMRQSRCATLYFTNHRNRGRLFDDAHVKTIISFLKIIDLVALVPSTYWSATCTPTYKKTIPCAGGNIIRPRPIPSVNKPFNLMESSSSNTNLPNFALWATSSTYRVGKKTPSRTVKR